MGEAHIDWHAYGRIDSGELATTLALARTGAPVVATVRFENTSTRTLHVFTFNLQSRLKVTLEGHEVRYAGPMVSVAPSERLYGTLEPGQALEVAVDLAQSHGLPADAAGRLVVRCERMGHPVGEAPAEAELTLRG